MDKQGHADDTSGVEWGFAGIHDGLGRWFDPSGDGADQESLALFEGKHKARAGGAHPVGLKSDGLPGFQGAEGLVENRFAQIDPAARAAVRIEKFDHHGVAGDGLLIDQSHGLGLEHADEAPLLIVAGKHHAMKLAAIRKQGDCGKLARGIGNRPVGRKQDGCQQEQSWEGGAQVDGE